MHVLLLLLLMALSPLLLMLLETMQKHRPVLFLFLFLGSRRVKGECARARGVGFSLKRPKSFVRAGVLL